MIFRRALDPLNMRAPRAASARLERQPVVLRHSIVKLAIHI